METYTATRIHVMRTKLISSEEYERLLRMSDKEVIGFLQSTDYRAEVDALAVKDLDDLEAIDKIIAANRKRIITKLERISGEHFRSVLQRVLRDGDAWNITVVAEAITGQHDPKKTLEKYARHGTFDPLVLTDANTIAELGRAAGKHVREVRHAKTFAELVRSLSEYTAAGMRKEDPYLIDEYNILTLLQFKREEIPPIEIIRHFEPGGTLRIGTLREAAREEFEGALHVLSRTAYGVVFKNVDPKSMVKFEDTLHRFVVKKIRAATRRRPLGLNVLANYLVEKDIEHENLRLLLKGRRLGMDEAFIKEYLVV